MYFSSGHKGSTQTVTALEVQVQMDQLVIAVGTSRRLGLSTDIMDGKELMRFNPRHKGSA